MADKDKCMCAAVTTGFERTKTVENYVMLRRQYPQAAIDVRMSDAVEFAYAGHGLDDFEIDSVLLSEAVTGNQLAISELSLTLLELIIARDRAEQHGGTHLVSRGLAISNSMVNQLINWMVDGLIDAEDPRLPADLIILIRHQTGGLQSDWEKEEQARERRGAAGQLAFDLALQGEVPTARLLAHKLGVNPSTIVRWLPEGALEKIKAFAELVGQGKTTVRKSTLENETAAEGDEI